MRKAYAILAVVAWLMVAPVAARAWNATGHRATALIAYRQLDEATRRKVAELLRKNPAAADLWDERKINSDTDDDANAFLNASTFADDVRPPSKFSKDYNRPTHHYVNFRYTPADGANALRDPVPGDEDSIIESYRKNVAIVKDGAASAEDRAVALCWIFHQAGDIHQPLHAIARFSKTFPNGDRGGNLVKPFPNPRAFNPDRASDRDHNLHAYWDGLLATDRIVGDFGKLTEAVNVLVSEYPRDKFADAELKEDDILAWAKESAVAAVKTVYRDLDPEQQGFDDLPVVYEAEAQKLGRRRMALAGYRLAEVLKGLFGDASNE